MLRKRCSRRNTNQDENSCEKTVPERSHFVSEAKFDKWIGRKMKTDVSSEGEPAKW